MRWASSRIHLGGWARLQHLRRAGVRGALRPDTSVTSTGARCHLVGDARRDDIGPLAAENSFL